MQPRATTDDAGLLAASAAGDREAFASFYRCHLPAVLRFLLRETGDRELAADLAAEVFASALLAADRYRPEGPSALPWLCAIARHKASESRRRDRAEDRARRRLGTPREPLEDDGLARVDELDDQASAVLQLVEQLPAVQREALLARVIAEQGYSEIALQAGASEAAVRQRVSRALAWLRTHASVLGAIASLGAGVALVLTLSAGTGPPAYALVVNGNGSLGLTVNELVGLGPANARLAKLGVPVRIAKIERNCHATARSLAPADRLLAEIVRPENVGHGVGGLRMLIRPDEIPAGDTLVLTFQRIVAQAGTRAIPGIAGSTSLYRNPPPSCVPSRHSPH
jgi:RNA polymerase sigma factor (sigma-70 family)